MRLPTVNPARPVQSLGRRDPRRLSRVAGIQARAAEYEGQGLVALGALATDVGVYLHERQNQQAVHEYNTELLKAKAEAKRALGIVSSPTMPADTPGLDTLDYQRTITVPTPDGGTEEVERTDIPTYEVGGEWLTRRLESVRDSALANISDERAKAKFSAQWALLEADAHTDASTILRKQRRDDLRGGYEVQLEEFLQDGDEENARALTFQAFAARTITGEELATNLEAIGERVDTAHYGARIAEADDASALDELMDQAEAGVILDPETGELRQARLDPDALWTIRQRANTKAQQLDAQRNDRHEAGGMEAAQLFLRGELTVSRLRVMGANDLLSSTQLLNFESKLREQANRTPDSEKSNPAALNAYRRRIRNMRWTTGDAGRVSENRALLERELYMAANGISPDGTEVTPELTLNGKDYDTLLSELDSEYKRTFSDPRVKQATDSIRAVTKVVPGMNISLAGNAPNLMAYDAGVASLNDYLDRLGAEADPVAWARDNAQLFDPQVYEDATLQTFHDQRLNVLMPYLPEAVRTESRMLAPDPSKPWPVSRSQYAAAIGQAYKAGVLDSEAAIIYYDQLNGREAMSLEGVGALP